MPGIWAWCDDLVVVLFEFLDDDTKLAQSCTDWLYVQRWYTVVPDTCPSSHVSCPASQTHVRSLVCPHPGSQTLTFFFWEGGAMASNGVHTRLFLRSALHSVGGDSRCLKLSPRFCADRTKESNACASFCPSAWTRARQATDRDLGSAFTSRKVSAWICAPRSNDRDLRSQRKFLFEGLDMSSSGIRP